MEEETQCKRNAKKQGIGGRDRVNGFIVRLPTCDALLAVHFCFFFYSKTRNTHMGERQMYIRDGNRFVYEG